MEQLNQVILRGVVGQVRVSEINDDKCVRITMATNYAYKAIDGTPVIETTWHNVVAWGSKPKTADALDVMKGDRIEVKGRIRVQRYTNVSGEEKLTHDIFASEVTILGGKGVFEGEKGE